ncbi:glutathione S-transferase family protein [Gilvimarinus sp. F26214L]|uniref:glutathione S-transferase family protein n=1 Tax=Gilvimarinus sp. DZF01 TaxID=3461371 RepID=UPI00404680EF
MGLLIDGQWHDQWYDTEASKGKFVREEAKLRNWITPTGEPGSSGKGGFKAEPDRYHLYVSLACPWAHRTLIFRRLKNLSDLIDVSVVSPLMLGNGWTYEESEGSTGDRLYGSQYHYELYTRHDPNYSGRSTVPLLWDKKNGEIVSNESAEIIRMFNSAFDSITGNTLDFWPEDLRDQIEAVNELVYHNINNGVYKAGFATSQKAYEEAYKELFSALDQVEDILSRQRYLVGKVLTEADWRLFTTLIRFDAVYHGHFKCNRQRLEDFPHLSNYVRELYQYPGVAETVSFDHIKRHYYYSHDMINPTRIVPVGPEIDYMRPHNRQTI